MFFFSNFGLHTLFWVHGSVCLTMIFIVYFTLPETQGKTLTQLENIYAKERKDDHQKIEKNNDEAQPKNLEEIQNQTAIR